MSKALKYPEDQIILDHISENKVKGQPLMLLDVNSDDYVKLINNHPSVQKWSNKRYYKTFLRSEKLLEQLQKS